jgi:hypothetical protein
MHAHAAYQIYVEYYSTPNFIPQGWLGAAVLYQLYIVLGDLAHVWVNCCTAATMLRQSELVL